MPEFRYSAVDGAGRLAQGTLAADSEVAALVTLREQGLIPVEVRPSFIVPSAIKRYWRRALPPRTLAVFCRQMAMTLRSGMGVTDGLDLVSRQVTDKPLRREALRLYREVLGGRSLSEAMMDEESTVPALLSRMTATGEATGNLEPIMQNMSQYYQQRYEIEKRVKSALTYPALLTAVGLGLLIYVFAFLIPQVEDLLKSSGARLPLITTVVLGITHFLQDHFLIFGVFLAVVVSALMLYISTPKGKYLWDRFLAEIPMIGKVVKSVVTARFAGTGAMVLKSGVPVLQALELLRENAGNEVAARALDQAVEGVRRGDTIAYHLGAVGYFDPLVVQMVRVGEETGSLEEMMEQVADFYEKEAQSGITQVMNLLEPVLVLVMGLVVGAIVFSIMFPLFDLVSSFKR